MPDVTIKLPVWAALFADGRYHVGADDDGSPLVTVWQTAELAAALAPRGLVIKALDQVALAELVRAAPGDSTLAVVAAGGARARLPLKKFQAGLATHGG